MSKNTASAAEVREWAAAKGLAKPGVRGRLPKAATEAFNKAHKSRQHQPGVSPAATTSVKVQVQDAKGRKRTKTVTVENSALRQIEGVGSRGRVSQAKAAEYVIGAGLV